jgi:hypothetical protein
MERRIAELEKGNGAMTHKVVSNPLVMLVLPRFVGAADEPA